MVAEASLLTGVFHLCGTCFRLCSKVSCRFPLPGSEGFDVAGSSLIYLFYLHGKGYGDVYWSIYFFICQARLVDSPWLEKDLCNECFGGVW